jgi:hypothetical protein
MLEIADERMRAVILLLSSSGIRVGAIPSFKLLTLKFLPSKIPLGIAFTIDVDNITNTVNEPMNIPEPAPFDLTNRSD